MDPDRAATVARLRAQIASAEARPAADAQGAGAGEAAPAGSPRAEGRTRQACGCESGSGAFPQGLEGRAPSSAPRARAARATGTRRDGSSCPDDDAERAFRKVERLSCVRERSGTELRRRLEREGFDPAVASAAVDRACACGLVDDLRFAEVLMRSRLSAGKGIQGIEAELAGLGIEASDVPGWPYEFAPEGTEGEVGRALAVLRAKPPRSKNQREGAYRRLVQKGFGSSVAATAARLWDEGQSE